MDRYLGFMMDPARHFMPVEDVLRIIDAAAMCGMNRMHWHLADDQGWRVEIRRWPELTRTGARRGPSYFGPVSETENNCGFYTQEDVRRVVAFAREKGIEIVPEVEIPGHESAMLAAYPQFGCRRLLPGGEITDQGYDYRVLTSAGVFPNLVCAGRDEAVQFLKDILDEMCQLFPGPEFHIGGDEAVKMHWRRCPDCQKRMKDKGLKNEHELQRWLVLEIGEYLAQKGKKTIVWNESLDGGLLPGHFIVQHWLGNDEETARFMAAGGRVIRSDVRDFYINRLFSDIDVYHIWEAPAVPDWAKGHEDGLLGVECTLWSEGVTNIGRAGYLLFPRMAAVALKAQRPQDFPAWESFRDELRAYIRRIAPLGLASAPEEIWHMSPEDAEKEQAEFRAIRQSPRMKEVFRINDGMLIQEGLEKLLRLIGMPWDFAIQVMDCAWAHIPEYFGHAVPCQDNGAGEMARQMLEAVESLWHGEWNRLPYSVFTDTMQCFARFVKEHIRTYGFPGFDRGFWTPRQVGARLFRLGELEYELLDEDGRRCVSIHIPSDARMEGKLLNESVEKARAFLAEYFPDWASLPMECCTWLLNPGLRSLLPDTSRILRFQRAFDIQAPAQNGDDVLEWVFRLPREAMKHPDLQSLPEDTALQRAMKARLLKGDRFGPACGVLARRFEET